MGIEIKCGFVSIQEDVCIYCITQIGRDLNQSLEKGR